MNFKQRFLLKRFIFDFYAKFFTLLFWQPVIWDLIKPKNGVIDNKSPWFHRHAVRCLNQCRGSDGWVIMSFYKLKVRDPHAKPMKSKFKYSEKHLFVI